MTIAPAEVRNAGRRSGKPLVVCLVSLALLTVVDLGTKEWAVDSLSAADPSRSSEGVCAPDEAGRIRMMRRPVDDITVVPGHLELRYAENCGGAFGMLRSAPAWLRMTVFGAAALGFTAFLLWLFVAGEGGPLFAVAVPLVVSGAVGNLVDRVRLGYVVDFIHYFGLFEYPTFNVADIWIAVGAGLLLIDHLKSLRSQGGNGPRSSVDD